MNFLLKLLARPEWHSLSIISAQIHRNFKMLDYKTVTNTSLRNAEKEVTIQDGDELLKVWGIVGSWQRQGLGGCTSGSLWSKARDICIEGNFMLMVSLNAMFIYSVIGVSSH